MIQFAVSGSAAAPNYEETFLWKPSLTFDAEKTKDGPLPVNAMQIVVHRGKLFCGMATSFSATGLGQQFLHLLEGQRRCEVEARGRLRSRHVAGWTVVFCSLSE